MAYLSYAQLKAYAAAAGAANPDTAAAIALAETGGTGNTNAHNVVPPDNSYGPWQINMLGSLGPDRRKKLGITQNSQLFDPGINARAMVMISNGGTNWTPWSTYTSGKYKSYLPTVNSSGTTVQPIINWNDPFGILPPSWESQNHSPGGDALNNLGTAAGTATDAAGTAADAIVKAGGWMSNASNWLRVLYVVAGGAIVLVGLNLLVANKILGGAAKALGGDSGGGTAKSAGTIAKAVFSPGGKAKAVTGAVKSKAGATAAAGAAKTKGS